MRIRNIQESEYNKTNQILDMWLKNWQKKYKKKIDRKQKNRGSWDIFGGWVERTKKEWQLNLTLFLRLRQRWGVNFANQWIFGVRRWNFFYPLVIFSPIWMLNPTNDFIYDNYNRKFLIFSMIIILPISTQGFLMNPLNCLYF